MLYTAVANSNLRLMSETAMGLVDSLAHDTPRGERVGAFMLILYGIMRRYQLSVPDMMQIVDNMERKAKQEKIPEFGATIKFIEGEL